MIRKKTPREASIREAAKLRKPYTRGKNAAGQTNGQFEQDGKRRTGHFTQAGEPPMMIK
jgi:hypothetical protein